MHSLSKYELTAEESALIGSIATMGVSAEEALGIEDPDGLYMSIANMCMIDPDGFCGTMVEERNTFVRDSALDPRAGSFVVSCYRYGIITGSATCANDLGAMFYLGEIVQQNYEAAAELYQIAMERGCYQSIVNLGYIYEYGRLGEADPAKAFEYYSLAAALHPSSEALYKLGDAYYRATFVQRDARRAFLLWKRAFDLADNPEDQGQAAFRLAGMFLYGDWDAGVDPEPLQALRLFQAAEVGMRISIANGMYYYENRLREAIEGQDRARTELENGHSLL